MSKKDKDKLELKKLRIEIEQLKRRWWANPSYLAALVPALVAMLGFLAALLSGFFDQRKSLMEQQVELLEEKRECLEEYVVAVQTARERLDSATVNIIESRSIAGSSKNTQQSNNFEEYNMAYTELVELISNGCSCEK